MFTNDVKQFKPVGTLRQCALQSDVNKLNGPNLMDSQCQKCYAITFYKIKSHVYSTVI